MRIPRFAPAPAAAFAFCVALSLAPARAAEEPPVSQEQFRSFLRVYKSMIDRFDRMDTRMRDLESKGGVASPAKSEETVDLSALEASTPAAAAHGAHGAPSAAAPSFKVFFDLNLVNRPGVEDFAFNNYHSLLFFELLPTPDIEFSFDVNPAPKFYELDWQVAKVVKLRLGKVWIPWDDTSPHSIYGGRVNVATLSTTGANAFLPNIWADLGVGVRLTPIDTPSVAMKLDGYAVNGFRSGGTNPDGSGGAYPDFSSAGAVGAVPGDNNRDKAFGGRLHFLLFGKLGLGASVYTGRWNDESSTALRVTAYGADAQLRLGDTEIRGGLTTMVFNLTPATIRGRGGYYAEVGQKLGSKSQFKVMARAGNVQVDDQFFSAGDQTNVGATFLWRPGLVEFSVEHSRDLNTTAPKASNQYTALRAVMAF